MDRPSDCRAGDAALARGAWGEARDAFARALTAQPSPEAFEGLGTAGWWLDQADVVFDSREQAYKLFVERGNRAGAARVAVWIAWDCLAFRGESAIANGWLQRARRLLEGLGDVPELAWLESRESALAMLEEGDPAQGDAHAMACIQAARSAGHVDFEMLGQALHGLALVSTGRVADGLDCLDEVNTAVVAGEMKDLVAIGLASCYMISGCDRVRDYDRAAQWCTRLKAFCAKWEFRPLFAVCRTQYASICMWRGTWLEAEEELTAATHELAASRPAMTADGVVRLGELRRRQGRFDEALTLFAQAEHHSLATLGRAELAYDRGDYRSAADQAERCLRRILRHNPTARAPVLELLVRALAAAGDIDRARTALDEIAEIARTLDTAPLRGSWSVGAGVVALAAGDADEARRHLEDAVDAYGESGAPFERGRARLLLAQALLALGRVDDARDEARHALQVLEDLQAEHGVAATRAFLASLPEAARTEHESSRGKNPGALTRRELEVLRLVAEGHNNQAIGEKLFVSEHTIHRHVANIFTKLSVSSRAAAVAQAARRGILK